VQRGRTGGLIMDRRGVCDVVLGACESKRERRIQRQSKQCQSVCALCVCACVVGVGVCVGCKWAYRDLGGVGWPWACAWRGQTRVGEVRYVYCLRDEDGLPD
jgi:hypothetical protein